MDSKNRQVEEQQTGDKRQSSQDKNNNPFENKQPVEEDIARSQEELDKEQQFKEAITERD